MKKHYTAEQKAKIVIEILKEERSIAQIASEQSIHPNQLYKWKALATEKLSDIFEDERKSEKAQQAEHERQLKELYAEIGKLSTQLNWLKKIWHRTSRVANDRKCSSGRNPKSRWRSEPTCWGSAARACTMSRLARPGKKFLSNGALTKFTPATHSMARAG